ncbi:MAG: ABC transporter ATP-binding protein [Pseudomonadota bacterium]
MTVEASLRFKHVKKTYDQKRLVVKDFSLDVAKGEFITLLGPSGSGKTTLLMMLAGFEDVTSGEISLDGEPLTQTAPWRRNIGMVFQNYALFHHMTVSENLAYPLKLRGMSKSNITDQVKTYLELIELAAFAGRYPGQLSGGQRQRVALARALIFEPAIVLMDEPLGALDKKLREQMQFEITRLHQQLGFTVIYVTHDQTEALTMSDRIAVFNDGVVQQCARPAELYEQPANAFVANFIGENNMISGHIVSNAGTTVQVDLAEGVAVSAQTVGVADCGACVVSVRPEKLAIQAIGQHYDNQVPATFLVRHYVGDFIRYYFRLAGGTEVAVKLLNEPGAPELAEGDEVTLAWQAQDGFAFASDDSGELKQN